jgi:hypothetical protein
MYSTLSMDILKTLMRFPRRENAYASASGVGTGANDQGNSIIGQVRITNAKIKGGSLRHLYGHIPVPVSFWVWDWDSDKFPRGFNNRSDQFTNGSIDAWSGFLTSENISPSGCGIGTGQTFQGNEMIGHLAIVNATLDAGVIRPVAE